MLLAHLLLSPLVFCRGTLDVFEYNKVALLLIVALVLTALGLSAWVRHGLGRGLLPLLREPVCLGVLLLAASAGVSTVTSLSPLTSLRGAADSDAGLGTMLAYAVLFFATRALCRTVADGRRLLTATVLATTVVTAYALVQALRLDPLPWDNLSGFGGFIRPFATLGHPNLLAAYLVMTFPVVAWGACRASRAAGWLPFLAQATAAILVVLVIVLSLSRGAWLALACTVTVLLVGWWHSGQRRWTLTLAWALVLAAAGFALFCLIAPDGRRTRDRVLQRGQQLGESASRRHIWRAGLEIFKEFPVCGCGLDTFQLAFGQKRPAGYEQAEWNVTPAKAHNEVIHILATQGALGGVAVLVLTAGLLLLGVRAWRRAGPDDRPLVAVLLAGITGFCVQNLFSFTVAACGTLFVTYAALLSAIGYRPIADGRPPIADGRPPIAAPKRPWVRALQLAIWAGAVFLIVRGIVQPYRASVACQAGDRLLSSDLPRALASYEEAVALDPDSEPCWIKLGGAAQLAAQQADRSTAEQFLARARQALARAAALVPADAYNHDNLGRLFGELAGPVLAEPARAFREFDQALALDPTNVYFLADAAQTALVCGDLARVRHYAGQGSCLHPGFALLRAQLGYAALRENQRREGMCLLCSAVTGDWHGDEAAMLNAYSALATTLLDVQQFEQARMLAQKVVDRRPDWLPPRWTLGQALEKLGRQEQAANEYSEILARNPAHDLAHQALRRLGTIQHHSPRPLVGANE